MELSVNEKRLLLAMNEEKTMDTEILAKKLSAPVESVLQWGYLLESKGLITIKKTVIKKWSLSDEGKDYAINGLPETQLLNLLKQSPDGIPISELKNHPAFKVGFGWMKKKNLATLENGIVKAVPGASTDEEEAILKYFAAKGVVEHYEME